MKRKDLINCYRIAKAHVRNHPEWNCYKHYSFIYQNNQLVEWGCNRRGSPLIGYPSYGKIHSETDAYSKAKGLLIKNKPFEVVNIRLNKSGELRMSKPCNCCFNFLMNVGCKAVWYSNEIWFYKLVM